MSPRDRSLSLEDRLRRIDQTRRQLSTAVVEARREVAARLDWRTQVRRRPLAALAAAAAAGLLVSLALGGRRRTRRAVQPAAFGPRESAAFGGVLATAARRILLPFAIDHGAQLLAEWMVRRRQPPVEPGESPAGPA